MADLPADGAVRQVPCPTCGTLSPFVPDNPSRAFCSERCKLIDLGAWAEERYRVPVATDPLDESGAT